MGPFKMMKLYRLVAALLPLVEVIKKAEGDYGKVLGQVRHALGALGAFLVAQGFVDQSIVTTVLEATPLILSMVWSWFAKDKN